MRNVGFCITLVFVVCGMYLSGIAQEATEKQPAYGWQNQIVGSVNLTQASFDNWTQGGDNTVAFQSNLKNSFVLNREKFNWSNNASFIFGIAKVGQQDARKSADEIRITSVYTRKVSHLLNPFVAFTALTQFAAGFKYSDNQKTQVSKFMDPGYFTQSLGLGYSPNDVVTTRIGGTLKETVTDDFPIPFADNPDTPKIEKTKIEPGLSSITNVKKDFQENIIFTSQLDLFTDFEGFNRIDVTWESDLTFKLSKFVNVTFEADLLYDRDIIRKAQFREVLSVGLTYTFL